MSIQIQPIVSEKANAISESTNRYSFKVSPDANKYMIKDAVENLSISALEKLITFLNTFPRKSLPTPAPVLDARKPTIIAQTAMMKAIPIIFAPVLHI